MGHTLPGSAAPVYNENGPISSRLGQTFKRQNNGLDFLWDNQGKTQNSFVFAKFADISPILHVFFIIQSPLVQLGRTIYRQLTHQKTSRFFPQAFYPVSILIQIYFIVDPEDIFMAIIIFNKSCLLISLHQVYITQILNIHTQHSSEIRG